ncbi:hypothetical protein D3C86_562870 [compost metagenome]
MAGTDSFNSSNQPKRAPNPFGDKSYSDSFVRATTAPLGKRMTRPLQASPEMLNDKLRGVEDQIGLCRTIIERFAPRMKLLKSAEAVVRAGGAPEPAPAPAPVAEPEPPQKPGFGKPGLGKKPLGKPAPKPAAAPAPAPAPGGGLAGQEKAMAAAIADRLRQDGDLLRRTQIAIFQFDDAQRSVQETSNRVDPIRHADPESAWDMIEALEVTKLQGKVYPICNFHEIFKRDPILSRVFPPPAAAGANGAPGMPPPGPPMPGEPPSMGTGPLGTGPLGKLDNLKGFFKR